MKNIDNDKLKFEVCNQLIADEVEKYQKILEVLNKEQETTTSHSEKVKLEKKILRTQGVIDGLVKSLTFSHFVEKRKTSLRVKLSTEKVVKEMLAEGDK